MSSVSLGKALWTQKAHDLDPVSPEDFHRALEDPLRVELLWSSPVAPTNLVFALGLPLDAKDWEALKVQRPALGG